MTVRELLSMCENVNWDNRTIVNVFGKNLKCISTVSSGLSDLLKDSIVIGYSVDFYDSKTHTITGMTIKIE